MKGSGALFIRSGLRAIPLLRGGGQEKGLRSGTEATPQIAALAAAAKLGKDALDEHIAYLNDLKAYALAQFQALVPGLVVVSAGDAPHICAISLPGYPSQVVVRYLSDQGFCLSAGQKQIKQCQRKRQMERTCRIQRTQGHFRRAERPHLQEH